LGLSFFGLNSTDLNQTKELRLNIYRQIHQICFHGKGGYSWPIVYGMPIYLRRFIFGEIKEHYEKEKEEVEKQKNPNTKTISPHSLKPHQHKPITPKSIPKNYSKIPKSPPRGFNPSFQVKYK
jgi:hypothetical protein